MYEIKLDEARLECLDEVLAFVDSLLERAECPMKAQLQIDVAVEELYVNIAHYAYAPETGPAVIRAEIRDDPRGIAITFIDRGAHFDPLAKPDPDVTLSAAERQIGGLGIYMVKKSVDTMEYARVDGENILTIFKAF